MKKARFRQGFGKAHNAIMDFADRYQYFKIHIQKGKIMNDLVIKTENLTKNYGEQKAVKSVNLHVKKGHIYGLLGRNGA